MLRPRNLTVLDEARFDRLEDVELAAAALRRAVVVADRIAVETACFSLARRLAAAPLDSDDVEEIRATVRLIESRVKFGVCQRACRFLLPLVAALERQIEEAQDLSESP